MGKITVYQFYYYDAITGKSRLSPAKRPAKAIELMGFKPVQETAEEVNSSELDEFSRYHPKSEA